MQFASLVSFICDIPLAREYYRRKVTLVYWLEKHLNEANRALSAKQVKLICMNESTSVEIPIPRPFISPQETDHPSQHQEELNEDQNDSN